MGKKICRGDDEDLLFSKGDLIQKILVRLSITSLLRSKSVCKSWCTLIQSSSFIHLHTTFNSSSSSSSSNKFGSFILLASVEKFSPTSPFKRLREYALLMLSSESESESVSISESGSGGWWWSTGSNYIPCWAVEEEEEEKEDYDDRVFKVDNGGGGGSNDVVFKLDSLEFPPCYKVYSNFSLAEIAGSCNGLICLYDRDDHKEISLWNPATRQFRILPKSSIIIDDEECPHHLVSFGFDVETKDYKVLLVTCFKPWHYRPVVPAECYCRVYVYSLSTDSWRLLEGITRLPGFPLYNAIQGHVLYLNGNCFFMAQFFRTKQLPWFPQDDRFLISFDFTKEIFIPMQLPCHHRDQELYLSSLGDEIAIFTAACYAKDNDNNDTWISDQDYKFYPGICSQVFDIWVLNKHGGSISSSVNKESWTKLHSFRIDRKRPGEWILPRGISNDGEFAMLETRYSTVVGKKMKLYNLVTNEVKKNFLSCSMVMSKANAYKPSLVSIIGGNGAAADDRVIGNGATNL